MKNGEILKMADAMREVETMLAVCSGSGLLMEKIKAFDLDDCRRLQELLLIVSTVSRSLDETVRNTELGL